MERRVVDNTARIYPRLAQVLARWGELGCEDLLELSLREPVPPAAAVPGFTLRLATEADLDAVIALYAADPWLYLGEPGAPPDALVREMYADRLRRGELCFLAVKGDQIGHANWSCYGWGDVLPDQPMRLHGDEVYTTDAVTAPAFRGRGLHAMVLQAMLEHARKRGLRRALTLARVDRQATYKAVLQVGYRRCGRLIYWVPKGLPPRAWILSRQGDVEPLFRPA